MMDCHYIMTGALPPGVVRTFDRCHFPVDGKVHDQGCFLHGPKNALVTAGLAAEEWFADPKERNHRGEVVRSREFFADGCFVTTTLPASGHANVRIYWCSAKTEHEAHSSANVQEPRTLH